MNLKHKKSPNAQDIYHVELEADCLPHGVTKSQSFFRYSSMSQDLLSAITLHFGQNSLSVRSKSINSLI